MTGLANRAQFEAKLLERCRGGAGALLLVDLDNFKQVNDTVGHAGGDECLKRAADRISKACRAACLVARMGGDEFSVPGGPGGDPEQAFVLAGRIGATIRNPVYCEDRPF